MRKQTAANHAHSHFKNQSFDTTALLVSDPEMAPADAGGSGVLVDSWKPKPILSNCANNRCRMMSLGTSSTHVSCARVGGRKGFERLMSMETTCE